MKNFTKLLQQQLREKGYLSIDDVMILSYDNGHYFDTARRKLEPDYTPYSEKVEENHRIKGWRYLPEADLKPKIKPNSAITEIFNQNLDNIALTINPPLKSDLNTKKLIQEPLIKVPYTNL